MALTVTVPSYLVTDELREFSHIPVNEFQRILYTTLPNSNLYISNDEVRDSDGGNRYFTNRLEDPVLVKIGLYVVLHENETVNTMTGKELSTILDEYYKTDPLLKKIDYSTWRALSSMTSIDYLYAFFLTEDKVAISSQNADYYVIIDCPNEILSMIMFEKGVSKMNDSATTSMMKNFEVGPVPSNVATMSFYGLAVKDENGNAYVYTDGKVIDVTGMTFDLPNMIYRIPAAINSIKVGDMVVHKNRPMYVVSVDEASISAVDVLNSEVKSIIPVTNVFGFNYITKIVCFMNFKNTTPSPDHPFGNIMPMIAASMLFGDQSSSSNVDFSKMMMFSAMCGNDDNPFGNIFNITE